MRSIYTQVRNQESNGRFYPRPQMARFWVTAVARFRVGILLVLDELVSQASR